MRRLSHPITVRLDSAGAPRAMRLNGVWRPVEQIVDQWVETGCWWDGEPTRCFWRVAADGLFDLSVDPQGQWRLELAWD
jgi:hypothetical protein